MSSNSVGVSLIKRLESGRRTGPKSRSNRYWWNSLLSLPDAIIWSVASFDGRSLNLDPSLTIREMECHLFAIKIGGWPGTKRRSSEPNIFRARRRRGSALLLVLFAIILLSGLVTATVGFVSNDVDEYGALNKEFRARQLAESGLAFGIDPQVQNQDRALLDQKMPDGGQFHVLISSESTKLNVNFILQNGRDDLLENLFIRWGVLPKAADAAVEGLKKYLSTSGAYNQPHNQSAQPAAANRQAVGFTAQFSSVAEMSVVPEFGPVMKKQPDWMNFFTTWGDGKIDINLADADTIALVTGVSPATANQVVQISIRSRRQAFHDG